MSDVTKRQWRLNARSAATAIALLLVSVADARAQSTTASGTEAVRGFYAVLASTMKDGARLGASGRFARLQPAVRNVFDVPVMARLAFGPGWDSLPAAQQHAATAAFERYIVALYADRFDTYSGEQLEVIGERQIGAGVVVQSRIVKSNGEPVAINYLMRPEGNAWQIADVYLDGTISELATRRSEFAAILRAQGIDGLIATLNRKAELLSGTGGAAQRS